MTELDKKRLRQLNAAVYHHLLSYSTDLGILFKTEAEKANAIDDVSYHHFDGDSLMSKWKNCTLLQIQVNKLEGQVKKLEVQIQLLKGAHNIVKNDKGTLPDDAPFLVLRHHQTSVLRVAFNPILSFLVSSDETGHILVWNYVTKGTLKHSLRGHTDSVLDLTFNDKGNLLASSSNDYTVRIWSCIDFQCLQTFYGHADGVLSVRFANDSENLISCSKDLTIRLWETTTGKCLKIFTKNLKSLHTLCILTPSCYFNKTLIAASGKDAVIHIWSLDTEDKEDDKSFLAHTHVIDCLCFATNSVLDELRRKKKRHSFGNQMDLDETFLSLDSQSCTASKQDTQYILSGSRDKLIKIWNINATKCVTTLQGHQGWVKQILIHPSSEHIISCGDDQAIFIWDIRTNLCCKTLRHKDLCFPTCIGLDPNTFALASGDNTGTVLLWESVDKSQANSNTLSL